MKPFNLERAIAGDPVVTRDGRPVKIAGYNAEASSEEKVAGWVDNELYSWNLKGGIYHTGETRSDLFMAPRKVKLWRRLHRPDVGFYDYALSNSPNKPIDYCNSAHWLTDWEEFYVDE